MACFGAGGRWSESTRSLCSLALTEREAACSGCHPNPGSPCKCKQSLEREDQPYQAPLHAQLGNPPSASQHRLQLLVGLGVTLSQVCQIHRVLPPGFLAQFLGGAGQELVRGAGAGDVPGQAGPGREQQPPGAPRSPPRQTRALLGLGAPPGAAAAPGTCLLPQVQRQEPPEMSLLDLCLHLRQQRGLLIRDSETALPCPFPFSFPFSFPLPPFPFFSFPFSLQILLRG